MFFAEDQLRQSSTTSLDTVTHFAWSHLTAKKEMNLFPIESEGLVVTALEETKIKGSRDVSEM